MLNWEASLAQNSPAKITDSLQLREGQAIADIGSGGGYFTLQFARKVGKTGRVYAVDVNPKYLDFIKKHSEREGLKNIAFVLSVNDELDLPESSLDLVFARNVFHHLPEPERYFRHLLRFLKTGARVAIIEQNRRSRFSILRLLKHYTPPQVILEGMEEAGYSLTVSFDFLPAQTFSLFKAVPEMDQQDKLS